MSSPSGSSQHRRSYFVAAALVALLAGAAVGLAFALHGQSAATKHARYTKKVAHAVSSMQQLADQVNSHYQSATGKSLVTLSVVKPELSPGIAAKRILIVHVATQQPTEEISPSQAVVFSACGTNDDCSIPGQLTVARRVLVQREALELALRTFDADPAASFVLVKTPLQMPGAGRIYVYFQRDALAKELEQPITKTLPLTTVPPDGVLDAREQKTVDRLVQNLAVVSQTKATVGANAIVLVPLGEALAMTQAQGGGNGQGTAP